MGNCISPCVFCSFTQCFAYFAPWGNVFWIQEYKNITMPNTGIPPPPFLDPCMGGRGGARGEPQERLRSEGKGAARAQLM